MTVRASLVQTRTTIAKYCGACADFHDHLLWIKLDEPKTVDGREYVWISTCPTSGHRVLLPEVNE